MQHYTIRIRFNGARVGGMLFTITAPSSGLAIVAAIETLPPDSKDSVTGVDSMTLNRRKEDR